MKLGVALLDFGGPQNAEQLEPFLSELLADVLPGPEWLSRPLGRVVARLRAPKVQPQYEAIGWSPLVETHRAQAAGLQERIDGLDVVSGMMFTAPTMEHAARDIADRGIDTLIALPMFPHYSLATTHAAFTFFHRALVATGQASLPVHWVPAWFDHPGYIAALAESIRQGVEATPGEGPVHLVFTPHGLPVSFVQRGDPYPDHIRASVRAVLAHMEWQGPAHVGWQSKVGPATWLTPSTPEVLERLGKAGAKRVCLIPISFVSEHIETLYEIDVEYREDAHRFGIPHFGRAPALGTMPAFLDTLADLVTRAKGQLPKAHCVRCLRERTVAEPVRPVCPNCRFTSSPAQLDQPRPESAG